jgi:glycosyltransferase involved in cell wall biosynthesis
MSHSIHTARWIGQLKDQGWDLHLFPIELFPGAGTSLNPELEDVTVHDLVDRRPAVLKPGVRLVKDYLPILNAPLPWPKLIHRTRYIGRRLRQRGFPRSSDPAPRLARVIRNLRPDLIHALSVTPAAEVVLRAKKHLNGKFPPWIATNWGSEIYLWGRLAEHEGKIRAILEACDYFSCECQRDVELARNLGFKNQLLPVLPIAGGFDLIACRRLRQEGPTSARRVIALKGYQDLAGRAFVGLRAIELNADLLRDYRVCVYSTSSEVRIVSELLAKSTGLSIEIIPAGSHDDMLRLHGSARVSIGLSISDAISTSMLEAMVMGSFPIQSDTSCANEWLEDGKTGILVHPDDPAMVAAALRRALMDDDLVNEAVRANDKVASERLDRSIIQPQVVDTYKQVFGGARPGRREIE